MLPEHMSISIKDNVIYWTNLDVHMTEREALEISNRIKSLAITGDYKALVVDNRMLSGTWPPEVDRVWVRLLKFVPTYVDKTITLCENVVSKAQLNYLSSQAGTANVVQAFIPQERDAIADFMKPHMIHWE